MDQCVPSGYFLMNDTMAFWNINNSIEIQLMRRFVQDNAAYALVPPDEFHAELYDLCSLRQRLTGTLSATTTTDTSYSLSTCCTLHIFDEEDCEALQQLIAVQLSVSTGEILVTSAHRKYKSVKIGGKNYVSSKAKPSIAMAKWNIELYGDSPTILPRLFSNPSDALLRPVKFRQGVLQGS